MYGFFFNDTSPTEIYTLSLPDALPIYRPPSSAARRVQESSHGAQRTQKFLADRPQDYGPLVPPEREPRQNVNAQAEKEDRSEEHTSELQSRQYLVCRLLLEKKQYKVVE